MSAQCETTGRRAGGAKMPFFERYLSLWVALCIVAGILLGQFLPNVFESLGSMEVASVNLPVAVLIWLMILPMLLKIDFHSLVEVRQHWKGVGVTLFINWGVKPFSMALLGWLFIAQLFSVFFTGIKIIPGLKNNFGPFEIFGGTLIVGCLAGTGLAADKLIVATDTNFKPFSFKNAQGVYTGFDVEFWEAIAKEMKIDYKLQPMDFNGIIPGLQSGQILGLKG